MKDDDKRGIILKELYKRRQEGKIKLTPEDVNMPMTEISRIAGQLYDFGLIWAAFAKSKDDIMPHGELLSVAINGPGVDVVEGNHRPPIAISIDGRKIEDNRSFDISGSTNIQIGDYNKQEIRNSFQQVEQTLHDADASPREKQDALEKLRSFAKHPLVVKLFGGLVGAL